jgi:ATP-dependent DNA helicase DinG
MQQKVERCDLLKMDKSQKNIVEAFKNSGNGVLFAISPFWEGVDCPGDILSSLIIVNLPFK